MVESPQQHRLSAVSINYVLYLVAFLEKVFLLMAAFVRFFALIHTFHWFRQGFSVILDVSFSCLIGGGQFNFEILAGYFDIFLFFVCPVTFFLFWVIVAVVNIVVYVIGCTLLQSLLLELSILFFLPCSVAFSVL